MTVCPALAAISPEEKSQNIDWIVEKSGIQAQLASIPNAIGNYVRKDKTQDEKTKQVLSFFEADFSVENLTTEIKKTLSEQYNDKYTREVLNFYNSELGVKAARCEVASSQPEFEDKAKEFDIENYDQKRQKLINQLFNDSHIQDFYYLLFSSMYESAFQSLMALMPEGTKIPSSKINEFKKQIKAQYYSEDYKQKLLAEYYIMYEDMTNDEVAGYDKFIRSKHGKWVNKCIETGMIKGFKVCTEKMVNDIMVYMKNNPGNDGEEENSESENED
jgi:hypothetical protein